MVVVRLCSPQAVRVYVVVSGCISLSRLALNWAAGLWPDSEVALAKACGVTRKAFREAVEHLEFCQLVRRNYTAGKIKISLSYSDARCPI